MTTPRTPYRRRTPERSEQAAIVKLLRSIGASVYVLGTTRRKGDYQGTNQTPGLPDLFAFIPAEDVTIPMWIEVKAAGGRLRPEQAHFKIDCDRSALAHLVGGVDIVIAWLKNERLLK